MTTEPTDEPTPTQKIWKPSETELQQRHEAAMTELYWTAFEERKYEIAGRVEDAARAHRKVNQINDKIKAIESLQHQAHAAAFAHRARQTYNRVLKSSGATTAR